MVIQKYLRNRTKKNIRIKGHSRTIYIGGSKEIFRINQFVKFEEFLNRIVDDPMLCDSIHAIRLIEILKKVRKQKIVLRNN